MNRKGITSYLFLLLVMIACKEDRIDPMIGNAIRFSSDLPGSRAAGYTADSYLSMGIYATRGVSDDDMWSETDGWNLFANQKVERTEGSGEWSYTPQANWQYNRPHTFFAYAPHNAVGLLLPASGGTDIPDITFDVQPNHADRIDLLIAAPQYNLTHESSTVTIPMHHALSKIGFWAASEDALNVKITSITITNLYASGSHSMEATASWSIIGAANATYKVTNVANGELMDMELTGEHQPISAPEGYLFLLPQTIDKAAKIEVEYTEFGQTKILVFALSDVVPFFTQGDAYNFLLTIKADKGSFVVIPADWNNMDVAGDVLSPHLNVQEREFTIEDKYIAATKGAYHLHFWTNQNKVGVKVESKMKLYVDHIGAVVTLDVDNIFHNLTLIDPAGSLNNGGNTYFPAPGELETVGTGFLNVTVVGNSDGDRALYSTRLTNAITSAGGNAAQIPKTNRFRITLNANGTRREIVVVVLSKPDPLNPVNIGYTPWIGTFHRANQTGERVIAARHSGYWTAEVLDEPSNTDNFVVISLSQSADSRLGTDNPDDAERHQVYTAGTPLLNVAVVGALANNDPRDPVNETALAAYLSLPGRSESVNDKGWVIAGNGDVYFRVGLKSRLPSPTAQPRYARIRMRTQSGESFVYVRQGEADDYVYAPAGDEGINLYAYSSGINSDALGVSRTNAMKISPYNLSVPRYVSGGNALSQHFLFGRDEKATFADYPTNVGWYFTWYFAGSTQYYNSESGPLNPALPDPDYRRAFHPANPAYLATSTAPSKISGFPDYTLAKFNYYLRDPNNDPCPHGYQMMSSDMMLHSLFRSFHNFSITESGSSSPYSFEYSEQSRDRINYLWGYYADGFYDRRPTRSLVKHSGDHFYRPYQLSGYDNETSYMGLLFYNHNTAKNNSLFIPGGGIRTSTTVMTDGLPGGRLDNVGGRVTMHLTNIRGARATNGTVGQFSFGAKPASDQAFQNPTTTTFSASFGTNGFGSHATPMRCVKTNYPVAAKAVLIFSLGGVVVSNSAALVQVEVDAGVTVTLPTPLPVAGLFGGWYTAPNGMGAKYEGGSSIRLSAGITVLYANWTAI